MGAKLVCGRRARQQACALELLRFGGGLLDLNEGLGKFHAMAAEDLAHFECRLRHTVAVGQRPKPKTLLHGHGTVLCGDLAYIWRRGGVAACVWCG